MPKREGDIWAHEYTTEISRFERYMSPPDDSGCIQWIGTGDSRYGRFRTKGGRRLSSRPLAHRWIYEYYFGPIPKGAHLHHICSNTWCVNIHHLTIETPLSHRRIHSR